MSSTLSDESKTRPAPTTLDEMQSMSSVEFKQVSRYQWGDSLNIGKVIRHLIRLAADELSWQGEADANSLRDFWYNPVKPILETAFPEKLADPEYDFGREMNKRLSMELSGLVKDGEITYRELNILDNSRRRELHHGIESDRLLFVEKDAAYRKLKPLASVYEMSLISGGGWQSTACLEDLANRLDSYESYEVFVLTDYDPTGFKIATDFSERADRLGITIESVHRLGINPEQLDEDTRQKQRFKPPIEDDSDREWMDTHGIEGRYGLELEAIGALDSKGEALRELVADELRPHIREDKRIKRDMQEAAGALTTGPVTRIVNDITAELEQEIRKEAREVIETKNLCPDPYSPEELHQAAIEGSTVSCDTRKAGQRLESELRERIQTGEISVQKLISDGRGENHD